MINTYPLADRLELPWAAIEAEAVIRWAKSAAMGRGRLGRYEAAHDAEELIAKLFEVMREKKISFNQASEQTGIAVSNFSRWKKGARPAEEKAVKIRAFIEANK